MSDASDAGFLTLTDLEAAASRKVSDRIWAYIQGGAGEERTLRANLEAFRRITLRPRVLVDVTKLELDTRLLNDSVRAPFFVAPMAYQAQVHPEGEGGVARAAREAGVMAGFSTLSSLSLEGIADASGAGVRWFQLYLQPDFAASSRLVERAEHSGYSAILLTVDVPVLGVRDRQARLGFAIDASVPVGNEVITPARAPEFRDGSFRLPPDASATWKVVRDLESITRLPIVIKGVLTAEDARKSVAEGARAVLVSNHGGRQLDGTTAAVDALPAIVAAVGTQAEVYVDGGVRRGNDVLAALALGAKAVGIGRPVLWALALGGQQGVAEYLSLLKTELATVMALTGRRTIAEVDRSVVSGP